MTQASPVLPGAVYHLVRRTEGRFFTLTPTYRPAFGSGKESADSVKDIYEYATAVASIKSGVQVVAWCVMSNHIHEVMFDRKGKLPDFLKERNQLLAKCINAHFGRSGAVFSRNGVKKQWLKDAKAIADTIAYLLNNPVKAGLVRRPHLWPGAISSVKDLCPHTRKVARPRAYLRNEKWEHEVEWEAGAPPEIAKRFGGLSEMQRCVQESLERGLAKAEVRHGGVFAGLQKIARTKPTTRATAWESFGEPVRRFAASTREGERAAITEWKEWQLKYHDARERMLRGDRVVWPEGTWKMHVDFGAERRGMSLRRGGERVA